MGRLTYYSMKGSENDGWYLKTSVTREEANERLAEYEDIGTVSEFRELKEKATAKKQNDKFEFSPCPRCGSRETLGDGFCYVCGTILD